MGVNEGDEFIWKIEGSSSKFTELFNDYMENNKHQQFIFDDDNIMILFCPYPYGTIQYWYKNVEAIIPNPSLQRDYQAIKIKITKIEDLKINYMLYSSINRVENVWDRKNDQIDLIDEYHSGSDYKLFTEKWDAHLFYDVNLSSTYNPSRIIPIVRFDLYPIGDDFMYFIDKDTNFEKVKENLNKYYDGDDYEISNFDYDNVKNELRIEIDEDDDDLFKNRDYIYRYSEEGVLLYYEWLYNGKTILKFELEGQFFVQYYRWIIVVIIALLGITIITKIMNK